MIIFEEPAKTEFFSQQGRKGHKEGFTISDLRGLCGLAVNFCPPLSVLVSDSICSAAVALADLAVKLAVAANGLVLIEGRVQLFDGDITGYSKQKVRPIRDVNIGTVPIDCSANAGVVQIRVLTASETLGV